MAEFRWAQRQRCVERLNELEGIARQEAVLAARRLTVLAEMAGDYPAPIDHLHNEIALVLNVRDVDAGRQIEAARVLTLGLPATMAALAAGSISETHATAVVDAVMDTSPEVAAKIDDFAVRLMQRESLTPQQVYRRAHRQVIKLDPPAAERRHREACKQRTLARRLSADGMATLRMYAPAQDVAAVWDACTVLAEAAEVPDDERDLGNRRVDALVDLANGLLDSGRLPGHLDTGDDGVADDGVADDEASTDDWARWAEEFADHPDFADEFEFHSEPEPDGAFDDSPTPATVLEWGKKYAAEDAWLARATECPTECPPATTLIADRPPEATRDVKPGRAVRRLLRGRPRPSVLMNVTVPIDLLLGDSTAVAEIPSLGPITAGQVASLLDQATLCRILCDPVTGEVLNVGRTRYVPTGPISRHVKLRDQTCVVPGCDQPAGRSDIDHRVPFSAGGETSTDNLNCLCRRHHRAKDGGGFHLARTETGWEWTTVLGRTYRRPLTALYEPGDNYWPLNICQTDGFDPNRGPALSARPAVAGPAPTTERPEVSDLPDDPPF